MLTILQFYISYIVWLQMLTRIVNGNEKQICVKNMQPENIVTFVSDLRNQLGNKVLPKSKPVLSKNPTVQGEWTPQMDLVNIPLVIKHEF